MTDALGAGILHAGAPVGFVPVPCAVFRLRPDGSRDDLQWARFPYFRKVFWSNVLRAGRKRPAPPAVLRAYIRHRGRFAGHFIRSLPVHLADGRHSDARRALIWALRASPIHLGWAMVCSGSLRKAALRTVFSRRTRGGRLPAPGKEDA